MTGDAFAASLQGYAELDEHAAASGDPDPDVRLDPEQAFSHVVQRADRVGRDQADVVVPLELGLASDPVSERLEDEPAEQRAPMGVTSRSWKEGFSKIASIPNS